MTTIVTRSDDVRFPVTIKVDGVIQNVSAGTVEAALVSIDGATKYVQATQTDTGGADWTNGIVEVVFAAGNTALLPRGACRCEIQTLVAGEKQTYYHDGIESRIGAIA